MLDSCDQILRLIEITCVHVLSSACADFCSNQQNSRAHVLSHPWSVSALWRVCGVSQLVTLRLIIALFTLNA